MNKRTTIIISAAFAALMVLLTIIAAATQFGAPARPLTRLEDPRDTVESFFSAVKAGDYAAADEHLGRCTLVNTELQFDSSVNQKLADRLLLSISYEYLGECEVTGMDAVVPVRLTYFDIDSASSQLNKLALEKLNELIESDYDVDRMYDENGEYLEEFVMYVFELAVDELLADAESYYTEKELDLVLFYEDSGWRIECSDELLSCIFGGLQ